MWFLCQTVQKDGSFHWRWVSSPSTYVCLRTLLQQQQIPKYVFCPQKWFFPLRLQKPTKETQWYRFFYELHARLHNGASLVSAMKQLPTERFSSAQQTLLTQAIHRLQHGQYIYPLFQPFASTLGEATLQLLHTSETGGYMERGFFHIQHLLEMQLQARQKIRQAMIYPGCLLGMMMIFLFIVSQFLLPHVENFIQQQHLSVGSLMESILQLNHHAGLLASLFFSFLAIGFYTIRVKKGSLFSFFLQMVGRRWFAYHLFCLNLSALLANRVPLLRSLQLAGWKLSQKEFSFVKIQQRIQAGEMLSQALVGFPEEFRQALSAAEIRGDLVSTLQQWSQRYYQRYEARWMQLLKWIEPLCIAGIAILLLGGILVLLFPLVQTFLSTNANFS